MKNSIVLLICALFLFSCENDNGNSGKGGTTKPAEVLVNSAIKVPDFSADTAYELIAKQLDFGPRVPNTSGHIECANWIIKKLESYGAKVEVQPAQVTSWDGTVLNIQNIIGSYRPDRAKRIMLSAHWDTRPVADQDDNEEFHDTPIPGANDGGSGVAVLLEIARQIGMDSTLNVGVDLFFWDAEDGGKGSIPDSYCLGSQYWAKNPHKKNYRPVYGINLDMVGGIGARFKKEGQSISYAPRVVKRVWNTGAQLGYSSYFSTLTTDGIIDDHLYINRIAGIPMIDIIDSQPGVSFFEHWHTMQDNMDAISKESLKATGHTVLTVIYNDQ
ncbi:MAG: M28 family peptidase [Bacteroidota bacterium]